MICDRVTLPGGQAAIVCRAGRRKRCACGLPATLECDWRVPSRRTGTCDAPICSSCTTSPAPEKDLYAEHAAAFDQWKAVRGADGRP